MLPPSGWICTSKRTLRRYFVQDCRDRPHTALDASCSNVRGSKHSLRFQSSLNEDCQEKNCIIDDVNEKPKPSPDCGKCVHQPLSTPHKDRSRLLRVARSDARGRQTLLGCFSMDGDDVVFESFALAARSRYAAEAASAMLWRSICQCIDRACGNPLPGGLEMRTGVIGPYSLF